MHEYAFAGAALQEAFRLELIVDGVDSVAAHAQVCSQLPTGGQSLARQVALLDDALRKLAVELLL